MLDPLPTHDYVGRAACGCVYACGWDMGDKDTAQMVAGWVKQGLTIERMPVADAGAALKAGLECQHERAEKPGSKAPKPPRLSVQERLAAWNAGEPKRA